MKGKVVNINNETDYDVYIGRAGRGHDGYFGNPFKDDTRAENIRKFKQYMLSRIESDSEYRTRVKNLHGKTLGCFCKPHPCHGDILVETAKQLFIEDNFDFDF